MAIVVMPREREQRQEQKEDPFDKILKGLQIAGGVTGLAVDFKKFDQMKQQQQLNAQQIESNNLSIESAKQGLMSPAQMAELQSKGASFSEPTGGAGDIRFRTPGGIKEASFSLPKPEAKPPKQPAIKSVDIIRDGKKYRRDYIPGQGTVSEIEIGPADGAKGKEANKEAKVRYSSINNNLTEMFKKIEKDGTWDAVGSQNSELQQHINEIAIDYAKLLDPSSVARPSEVEQILDELNATGFWRRESTAVDNLHNFRLKMTRRINVMREQEGKPPLPMPGKPGERVEMNGKEYIVGYDGYELKEAGDKSWYQFWK